MRRLRCTVTVLLVLSTFLAIVPSSQAQFLSVERAKRAIATKAYLVNGAGSLAYGARACRRLGAQRVSCQAYVEKEADGGKHLCVDRMTAVASGGRVVVKGAARPSEWRCEKVS